MLLNYVSVLLEVNDTCENLIRPIKVETQGAGGRGSKKVPKIIKF